MGLFIRDISVSADKLKSLAKEHLDRVDRDRTQPTTSRLGCPFVSCYFSEDITLSFSSILEFQTLNAPPIH